MLAGAVAVAAGIGIAVLRRAWARAEQRDIDLESGWDDYAPPDRPEP